MTSFGYFCISPVKKNGIIIGVLGVSVPTLYAHPAWLNLVLVCINFIESALSNLKENHFNEIPIETGADATSQLIASTVHDFKNPLSVIRGLGELGRITSKPEEIQSYFKRIIKQVDDLNDMVTELLSILKPDELARMSPIPIISEVVQEAEPICNTKGIRLNFTGESNRKVLLSEALFKRSINNLVTNAIQAMDNGGKINIKVKSQKDYIFIAINDTAGGIPEDIKDNIFEPFTFRRKGGTGLGLFMVYHSIVNTHRGEIWFETKYGQGTTFYIKLPTAYDY